MRPEDLADSVAEPGPAATCAAPKISWVLMQDGGVDPFRHVIPNHQIRVGGSEIPRISRRALPKRWVRVGQLALPGKCSGQNDCAPIERVLRGNHEFLSRRERLVITKAGRRSVIGNDAEDPLVLRWRQVAIRR